MDTADGIEVRVKSRYGPSMTVFERLVDRQSDPCVNVNVFDNGHSLTCALTLDQAQQVRDAIDACIRAQRGEA